MISSHRDPKHLGDFTHVIDTWHPRTFSKDRKVATNERGASWPDAKTEMLPSLMRALGLASLMSAACCMQPAAYPSHTLSPTAVVESTLDALRCADNQRTFRFCSPETKRALGVFRPRYLKPFWSPPDYSQIPSFARLVGCEKHTFRGTLEIHANECLCRTRVWTSQAERHFVDVAFFLSRQPLERPACYEDDPMQAGISAGPPGAGCWLVDGVRLDDGGGGGDGDPLDDGGDGGGMAKSSFREAEAAQMELLLQR